jgi:hypothetical protein
MFSRNGMRMGGGQKEDATNVGNVGQLQCLHEPPTNAQIHPDTGHKIRQETTSAKNSLALPFAPSADPPKSGISGISDF